MFFTELYLFALAAWKLRSAVRKGTWLTGSHSLRDVLLADSFKYYLVYVRSAASSRELWLTQRSAVV